MRENWRVVLSGVFTKFLYYVFVSAGRQKKREREKGMSSSERTSILRPDLNFPFNRSSTQTNRISIFFAALILTPTQ